MNGGGFHENNGNNVVDVGLPIRLASTKFVYLHLFACCIDGVTLNNIVSLMAALSVVIKVRIH